MNNQTQLTDQNRIDEAYIYCRNHDLLRDPLGRSFEMAYQHKACDQEIAAEFIARMQEHQRSVQLGNVPPFKLPNLNHGLLLIGHAWGKPNDLYRIPIQYLSGNTLVTGSSGSGKTLRAYFMVLALAGLIDALWLIDLRKTEFRRLRGAFRRTGKQLICLDARQMKLNPLQPPVSVEPRNWASQIAELLIQVLRLPPRTSKLTATLIHQLYIEANIYNGGQNCPTLFCLLNAAKQAKNANPQSRVTLIDNLESLLLSSGSIFRYRQGWTTHDLSKHSIVFELGGISELLKDLILNTVILGEFTSRIAQGISNPHKPNLWIGLDEANRLASGDDNGRLGLSSMISVVRGTGIALDLSCQTASLDTQILANTATKIIGRTSHFPDLQLISRAIGLSSEQTSFLIHNLKPGKFAMQLGEGEFRHPFLIQIPRMNLTELDLLNEGIATDDLGSLAALPVIPLEQQVTQTVTTKSQPTTKQQTQPTVSSPETSEPNLPGECPGALPGELPGAGVLPGFDSGGEAAVMKIIVEQPFIALKDLIKASRMSSKTVANHRKNLIAKNYIRERKLHKGGSGRSAIHLEPLPLGQAAVKAHLEKESSDESAN